MRSVIIILEHDAMAYRPPWTIILRAISSCRCSCSFLSISLVMVGSYFVELPVCGDEAHATDGLDAAVGLQMELSAKSIHEHVDDSRVVLEVDAPHVFDNILTWADTVFVPDEIDQQVKFSACQLHILVVGQHLMCGEIDRGHAVRHCRQWPQACRSLRRSALLAERCRCRARPQR